MGWGPIRVTAELVSGIAHAAPWGPGLDGLLASEVWGAQKAAAAASGQLLQRAMDVDDPVDLDLPLARCTPTEGPWHWAATCAWPGPGHVTEVHPWTARLDTRDLEAVASRLPAVSVRQGRYRARRMPLLVTITDRVTWQAVGDAEAVAALVEPVRWIGKKRRSGEGEVLAWHVEPAPDLEVLAAAHLHPDATLGRPVPAGCWDQLPAGTRDGGMGPTGIRPPTMHPARTAWAHLPVGVAT